MLAVRLDEKLQKRLETLSKRTGRSRSSYMREALERYLDDLEDYALAVAAYEQHLETGGATYTSEEVRRRLDLDD